MEWNQTRILTATLYHCKWLQKEQQLRGTEPAVPKGRTVPP